MNDKNKLSARGKKKALTQDFKALEFDNNQIMSFKRRIEVNDKSYFELIMYVSTILLVET